MIRVAHKYMPDHMSEEELKATFTARQHTLDYLTEEIRKQTGKQTLTSYLIIGPRGAGKTTIIRMLCLRLCQDETLTAAWLPVRFPEELPNVTSLRDLLATALDLLAEQGVSEARDWYQRVEDEEDDADSQELAITGLQQIAQAHNKRLILLIENLDMLFERGVTESTRATLRRLLMTDPFMMIVGSAVQVFPAVRAYDEAFFNYFCPVPLERLNEQQAGDILKCRAKWDGNEQFDAQYQKHKGKIRAISMLTGGNPRFLLMVYEILTLQEMGSAVQALRALVDELTPLLKDILEHQLTPQQVRILDALMQLNGKAKPSQLAQKSRLPLNIVTTQLKRLVEADLLELQGGGKGRPAWYTVTDRLFYTWYQMRYLRPQRRRIEMFVEVLQLWFEADERIATLRSLSAELSDCAPSRARLVAQTTEYFAASLEETPYMEQAHTLAVQSWIKAGEVKEALALYNEGRAKDKSKEEASHSTSYVGLSRLFSEQGDIPHALEVLKARLDENPDDLEVLMEYGTACGLNGDHAQALSCFDRIVTLSPDVVGMFALALLLRGLTKKEQRDYKGAIADFTAIVELPEVPVVIVTQALVNRGIAKVRGGGGLEDEIADYTAAIELADAPSEQVAKALFNRAISRGMLHDFMGAIADYTALIELVDVPVDQVARAFFNRGVVKEKQEDHAGAIEDYTAVIELPGAPIAQVAKAFGNRGVSKGIQQDFTGAISDYSAVVELSDAPIDQVAKAIVNRGIVKRMQDDFSGAIADYNMVIELSDAPVNEIARALVNRGVIKGMQQDLTGAMADCTAVVEMADAPVSNIADALINRGIVKLKLQDYAGTIADCTTVINFAVPIDIISDALINRGIAKAMQQDLSDAIKDFSAVVELADASAPVDHVARAFFIRGISKEIQKDFTGAIMDYTAVVKLTDAPVDLVANALVNRSRNRNHQGKSKAALVDCILVLELVDASLEFCIKAGIMALHNVVSHPSQKDEDAVISAFNTWLARFDTKERTAQLIELLATLAEPKAENVWVYAVRRLIQDQAEVSEELEVLPLVADILETKDESKLDPLPPEQRDFALEVLKKFKPAEDEG